jgi:transposase
VGSDCAVVAAVSGGGRRWGDHRQVLNAILWKPCTDAPWRDLPERYGPWKTAWQKILDEVIVKDDAVGHVELVISVDSSVVRAHQHAAGARKGGATSEEPTASPSKGEHLGRSRGGLNTKIHLAVDGRDGPGRPRSRPEVVILDKAYSHPSTRAVMRRRGIRTVCPEREDQTASRAAKGSRGGRPSAFDPDLYKQRNVVER